jgi:indolepyruvate ferredoxin oxidoreductase beta subunit
VLLGAIAGSGALPVPSEALADAIRTEGKAVEANLAGFEAGLAILRGTDRGARAEPATAADETAGVAREAFLIEQRNFPDAARELVALGARRVLDFQDQDYETLYLERLERVAAVDTAGDGRLTAEAARQLAVRMTYQDVIRVAQLKTGAERAARVRAEVGARAGEPVVVTEFLEPGLEEACALLPGFVAWPILRWAERRGWTEKLRISLGVRTTGLIGFFSLWLIARMRPWRRIGHRFGDEQTAIDRWLDAVCAAAGRDPDLALEIVACAALFKGYGETHRRGGGNYRRIEEAVIGPALTGAIPVSRAAAAVRAARSAALAGPGGDALAAALAATAGGSDGSAIASVERSDARAAVDAAGSGTTAGAAESKMPATAKGSDAPAVDAGSAGSGGPAAATAVGPTTTVAGGDTAGSRGPAAAAADGPGATAGADGKKTSTATAASAAE